jgi:hypothetical protein
MKPCFGETRPRADSVLGHICSDALPNVPLVLLVTQCQIAKTVGRNSVKAMELSEKEIER